LFSDDLKPEDREQHGDNRLDAGTLNSKLYIGNLSASVSEEDLRLLFSRKGTVTEVTLMLDPATGQSRGFAFVTMATPELAAAALKDFHSYNLGGRNITVTEARPPQEPKGLMSEGFDLGHSAGFRPGGQRDAPRRRSADSPHRKRRGR
jgi:RNA recognition motif-containing protein